MDLLQKLTLYDLLGYALPGTFLAFVVGWEDISAKLFTGEDVNGGYWVVLVLIGYVVGIIVSELAGWLFKVLEIEVSTKEVCEQSQISLDLVGQALFNAGMMRQSGPMDYEKVSKYSFQIYADIQSDSQFTRVHNYASAALLYKNLAVVFVLCLIIRGGQLDWKMIVVGIVVVALLARRWRRFECRKSSYSLSWFVKKYCKV